MQTYKMTLEHEPNPDIGGYWSEIVDTKPIKVKGLTIVELRDELYKWQDRNNLGGGNVPTVWVYLNNNKVGYFSYNGRFWLGRSDEDYLLNKELILEEKNEQN